MCLLYSLNGTNNKGDLRCLGRMRKSRCRDLYPSREAMAYVARYWATHPPPRAVGAPPSLKISAGFYGIALALHLCAEVDVYGFNFSSGHYYKKSKHGKRAFDDRHSWAAEHECLRQLSAAKLPHVRVHS